MKKFLTTHIAGLVVAAIAFLSTIAPANAGTMYLAAILDGGAPIVIPGVPPTPQLGTAPDIRVLVVPVGTGAAVITAIGSTPGDGLGSNLSITASVSGVLAAPHTLEIFAVDVGFLLPTIAPLTLKGSAASNTSSVVTTFNSFVFSPPPAVPPPGTFPVLGVPFASALGATIGFPALTVIGTNIPVPYALASYSKLQLQTGPGGNAFDLTTSITPNVVIPEPAAIVLWSLMAVVVSVPALRRLEKSGPSS